MGAETRFALIACFLIRKGVMAFKVIFAAMILI